jgi:Ca2+-binding RTX toxin-like protein
LKGGDGDDILIGRYGADVLIGGVGRDTASYATSLTGVEVRLDPFLGTGAGGEATGDQLIAVENIVGSSRSDVLVGDFQGNLILGGEGNDAIIGREGADTLYGEAGNDTLLGGVEDDFLSGGAGADIIGGGAGNDAADYSASGAGVSVNLATGVGLGGDAQGDVLVSIENLIGSAFDDTFVGKANFWDNVFDAGAGNDTITGGLGADTFVFRLAEGSDTITDFAAGAASGDAVLLANFGAAFDSFAEVIAAAAQVGADTIINFGGGQTLTLQNVTLGNLNAGDFLFGP